MELAGDSFQRLLDRIEGAADSPQHWRQMDDSIRQTLGAASVHMRVLDKLRQPVVLMTPAGRVVHVNDAARDLLGRTRLVQVVEGRLHLPAPALSELLRKCAVLAQGDGGAGSTWGAEADFQSLQVRDPVPGGSPLYVFFSMVGTDADDASRPLVLLMFYHPASAAAIDPGLLHGAFGLTPVEARIASLLAEGLSLKEIAQQQGTQHETVRKQLRSIYIKTATNRQADLVRLLLHLPHVAVQE